MQSAKMKPKKITRELAFRAPAYYFNHIIKSLTGEPYEQAGLQNSEYYGCRRDFHNSDIRADKTARLHVHGQPGWQGIQKSGEVFRGGVYGDMFSVRCVHN